jgi:ATP-binding cassette subfamily B protein RaxB
VGALRWVGQAAPQECGLCCVLMLARAQGFGGDIAALRTLAGSAGRGQSLRALRQLGAVVDLAFIPRHRSGAALADLPAPALLHWDGNHFVVLAERRPGRWRILDPARGDLWLSDAAFQEHFTGYALELETPLKPGAAPGVIARLRPLVAPLWPMLRAELARPLLMLFFATLLLQGLALLSPLYVQLVVDEAVTRQDEDLLLILLLAFLLLVGLRALLTTLRGDWMLRLGERLGHRLGTAFLSRVFHQPLAFFEHRDAADLGARLGALGPLREALTQGVVLAVLDAFMALSTLALMLAYAPALTAVTVVALLLYGGVLLALRPRLRRQAEASLLTGVEMEARFLGTFAGLRAAKLHGVVPQLVNRIADASAEGAEARWKEGRTGLGLGALESLIFGLEQGLLVFLGAKAVLEGTLTLGMFYAFISFKSHFLGRMMALFEGLGQAFLLPLHAQRLADALADPVEGGGLALGLRRFAPLALAAEDLAPFPRPGWQLGPVSFSLPAGGMLLITGPSGAGKSSLLAVLAGLSPPQTGTLTFDEAPLWAAGAPTAALAPTRRRLGAVLQQDALFAATLRDNIAYFDPDPEDAALHRVMAMVGLRAWLRQCPLGLDTCLGPEGEGLSRGQRQRLLLARALYREPDLLILDEVTAGLDDAGAHTLARRINAWPMTRIVVSHAPERFPEANLWLALDGAGGHRWLDPSSLAP